MKIKFVLLVITLICAAGNNFAQEPMPSPTPKATPAPKPTSPIQIADRTAVSSLNRLNFYTGSFFAKTTSEALFINSFKSEDKSAFDLLLPRIKSLYAILKGRAEAEDLASATKQLQTSNKFNKFLKFAEELYKIQMKYKTSLANEQKWYFEVAVAAETVQDGINSKNVVQFSLVNEDFAGFVKSVPKGTPPPLLTSLKQTSEILKNTKYGINTSDSDYAALKTQLKSIYDSIGQLKNEDKI